MERQSGAGQGKAWQSNVKAQNSIVAIRKEAKKLMQAEGRKQK